MLLGAIIGEFKLLKNEQNRLYGKLKGRGNVQAGEKGIPDLAQPNCHVRQMYAAHVTTIVGTLVWGFGEVLLGLFSM